MTSQPGSQASPTHILHNISRSKYNQKMKFGQVLEYDKRVFFFKNHAENEARSYFQTSLFFIKVLNEVKASGLQLSFSTFR